VAPVFLPQRMLQDFRYHIGFRDLWLRLLGIPFVGFVLPMAFFDCSFDSLSEYIIEWFVASCYTAVYWHGDVLMLWYFRKRWPEQRNYMKRLVWSTLLVFVFTVAFSLVSQGITLWSLSEEMLGHVKATNKILYGSLFVTATVLAIYEAVYAVSKWKESLVESARLRKANMQAQLETLKNQVNPHFLFNSLNTLAAIIPEDPDKAVTFVEKLSKVYRYILEIRKRELIPLREEIDCICAYGFLTEMRFGENLKVNINIPEARRGDYIVPLSLQILVENAIKHNVVSTSKPLAIDIGLTKDGHLMVTNNLQKKLQVKDSTGTGLDNINSRYQLLTGQRIDIITTQSHFRVILPLVPVAHYELADH